MLISIVDPASYQKRESQHSKVERRYLHKIGIKGFGRYGVRKITKGDDTAAVQLYAIIVPCRYGRFRRSQVLQGRLVQHCKGPPGIRTHAKEHIVPVQLAF